LILLLYVLFFLSGAAALVYEVAWVRSLALVFGGSHLAVTTVLAVFMGGLALGSVVLGRRVDRTPRPLRLYGLLELGIGASAAAFLVLMRLFPSIHDPLARSAGTNLLALTALRIAFAAAAIGVPTTLMGGTLPVLSRFVASRPRALAPRLALLYGLNTLGAVAGTLVASFVLLPSVGLTRTLILAAAASLLVGFVACFAPARALLGEPAAAGRLTEPEMRRALPPLPARLVLWGIGVSGLCALGYEVLWTRVLSMVVGTSVYSFAIMLVAFLGGIAAGSHASPALARLVRAADAPWRPAVASFGAIQLAIALSACGTTYALRALPQLASRLQGLLAAGGEEFAARQATSFALAFAFMALPAFCMGLALPLAGSIRTRQCAAVGGAVGEVLGVNTLGAIAGAAGSGFVLVFLFGIERSLQLLSVLQAGCGMCVLASALLPRSRVAVGAIAAATAAALVGLSLFPHWGRVWSREFFAVYRNNQRSAFATAERIRDALANTDVLYYSEGLNETISVIRPRRAAQAFIVNGRVEASTHLEDVQCQRALGHLPMLVHPDPRRVFVLGLGTGMTAGATSIHPEVESITLAEIERGVLPAARTFAAWNHDVLDHPRLCIVHDDGRNFLRSTRERFDVITADPIHPWSGGAAYLYTTEYFRIAADALAPGGVLCQWLPLYELSVQDVRSVVATFAANFPYTAVWLTHYDAELLGSRSPIVLDEASLARRFADPAVAADLAEVGMGSPSELLSWFLMGDAGVRAFAAGGRINTDDNLELEFAAPRSQGVLEAMGRNVEQLTRFRDAAPGGEAAEAASLYDRAHVLGLLDRWDDPELVALAARLRREHPDYAPGRFLEDRRRLAEARAPRPLASRSFAVLDERGARASLEITAVAMHVGQDRGALVFVDNVRREIYGQIYVEAPQAELAARLERMARAVLSALAEDYAHAAAETAGDGRAPAREALERRLRASVVSRLAAEESAAAAGAARAPSPPSAPR
jgi:spermidine synthase